MCSRLSIPFPSRLPITSKKPWSKLKKCRTETETSTLHDTVVRQSNPSNIRLRRPATPTISPPPIPPSPALYYFHSLINLGPVPSRMNLYQTDVLVELHSSWRNLLFSKNSDPLVLLWLGLMQECIGMVITWCVVVVVVVW